MAAMWKHMVVIFVLVSGAVRVRMDSMSRSMAVTLMLMVVQMLRVSVLVRIIGRGVVRPTGKEVYRQACPAWYLYPERKEDHD
jgi:hypothetical protein